jgi:hypothetical protein
MGWFKKKANDIRSVSIKLAVKCGFMTVEQGAEADSRFTELCAEDTAEHPTLQFLESEGYLTPEEVQKVQQRRLEEAPAEANRENLKKARQIQRKMEKTGSIQIAEIIKARA